MRHLKQYYPFITASVLVCMVLAVIYPYYQYYIDPDATSYLTIAKRYAAGDYTQAINGYWSPWSCWLTALVIKCGIGAMFSAVIVNAVGGLGLMYITCSFFIFFHIEVRIRWLLSLVFVVFIPYAVFWQLFDDLWQAFFLLCILRLMVKENFVQKPALWVLAGLLGALAYFTKSYAFSFFMLNIVCCSLLSNRLWLKEKRWQWLKISAVAIAVMMLCSMPWIYLLHMKYGKWITSTAVNLNMSWNLVGHPYWKAGIRYLIPPVYPNSVSYWEDPYRVNGITPGFLSSFALFKLQIARFVYTFLILVSCLNALSAFCTGTYILALLALISKKIGAWFPGRWQVVCLSYILFPIGLVFIKSESRYIWYTLPLSMLVGAMALQKLSLVINKKWISGWMIVIFASSYLCYPVLNLKTMFKEGESDHQLAALLTKLDVHGSFTANATQGLETQRVQRLAYFSGNPYYNMPVSDFSHADLLSEMRLYKVKYYFYYCQQTDCGNYIFTDEMGQPVADETNGQVKGLKVFRVN